MSQNWALHLVVMVTTEWWITNMSVILALTIAVFTSTVDCGHYPIPSKILEAPKIQSAGNRFNQNYDQYSPPQVSAAGVALTIPGRTAPYTLVQGNRQYVNQYRAQQNYYAHKNLNNIYNFRAPQSQYQVHSQKIIDPADIYSEQDSLPLPPATGVQPPNLRPPPSQTVPSSPVPIVSKPVEIEHNAGYASPETFPPSFLPEISTLSVVQHQQEPAYLQSQQIPPVYYGFQPIYQPEHLDHQQVFNSQTLISQQSHPGLHAYAETSSPEQSVSYTISDTDKHLLNQYENSRYHSQQPEGINISVLDNIHGVQSTNFIGNQINYDATYSQKYANDALLDQNNHQILINNYNNNRQIPTSPPFDSGFVNTRSAAEVVVTKHVYVHLPPPDAEETEIALSTPQKKTYNIIFLKVPSYESYNREKILKQVQQQTVEDKTLIYVLVKKPVVETVSLSQVREPSKPEVFFVNYKGNPISSDEASQTLHNSSSDHNPIENNLLN